MVQHRQANHPTSKPCLNIDQCKFGIDCFYSHIPIPEGCFRCLQCGEEFETIDEWCSIGKPTMSKIGVKICTKFMENKCTKGQEYWWLHETVFSKNSKNYGTTRNKNSEFRMQKNPTFRFQKWQTIQSWICWPAFRKA